MTEGCREPRLSTGLGVQRPESGNGFNNAGRRREQDPGASELSGGRNGLGILLYLAGKRRSLFMFQVLRFIK